MKDSKKGFQSRECHHGESSCLFGGSSCLFGRDTKEVDICCFNIFYLASFSSQETLLLFFLFLAKKHFSTPAGHFDADLPLLMPESTKYRNR